MKNDNKHDNDPVQSLLMECIIIYCANNEITRARSSGAVSGEIRWGGPPRTGIAPDVLPACHAGSGIRNEPEWQS